MKSTLEEKYSLTNTGNKTKIPEYSFSTESTSQNKANVILNKFRLLKNSSLVGKVNSEILVLLVANIIKEKISVCSINTILESIIDCSPSTISKAIKRLHENGLIKLIIKERNGKHNFPRKKHHKGRYPFKFIVITEKGKLELQNLLNIIS